MKHLGTLRANRPRSSMTRVFAVMLALGGCGSMLLQAQCVSTQDHQSDKKKGIIVESMVLSGTQTISSSEMAEITATFVGSCFDERHYIGERIKDEFQQRGYYKAKVNHVTVKAADPLARPKPVAVEADVAEGPLYNLSEVQFDGNHAFTSERLTARFPFKPGEVFNTERVRSGLSALARLYHSEGYLDFAPAVAVEAHSEPTVTLKISIREGKQYHMGKLQIAGSKEQTQILQMKWSLPEGAPFDAGYLDRFLDENKAVLPSDFEQRNAVRVLRNCREATVAVFIAVEKDSAPRQLPSEIDCGKDASGPKT